MPTQVHRRIHHSCKVSASTAAEPEQLVYQKLQAPVAVSGALRVHLWIPGDRVVSRSMSKATMPWLLWTMRLNGRDEGR